MGVARGIFRGQEIGSEWPESGCDVTLLLTFNQRERDSEFEFCLSGRVGYRGLARSFVGLNSPIFPGRLLL